MRYNLLFSGVLGWALAMPLLAGAQTLPRPDSLAVAAAVQVATAAYTQLAQPESVLFSGPEYVDHTLPGTIGHQGAGGLGSLPRCPVSGRAATLRFGA